MAPDRKSQLYFRSWRASFFSAPAKASLIASDRLVVPSRLGVSTPEWAGQSRSAPFQRVTIPAPQSRKALAAPAPAAPPTLDAVIDVVCADAPRVRAQMLGPDDPGPKPGQPRDFV